MRSLVAAVVAAITLGCGPALAGGGVGLVAASPAPGTSVQQAPDIVVLTFAAPADSAATIASVVVGDRVVSSRARVDREDRRRIRVALTSRQRGSHVVRWRLLTEDGHPRVGTFTFAVASGAATSDVRDQRHPVGVWIAGVGRYLTLSSLIAVLGIAAFQLGVVSSSRSGNQSSIGGSTRAIALAGVVGLVLWLIGICVGLGERDALSLAVDTRWGRAWFVVLAATLAVLGASVLGRRRIPHAAWGVGSAAALGLSAISWSGHASSDSDRVLGIASDLVHNVASAGWLGALLGLCRYLTVRGQEGSVRATDVSSTIERFSLLAIASVAMIVLTGVYRALAEIPTPGAVVTTAYGWALVVKLSLVGAMLAFGAVNRLRAQPRLARAALGLDPNDGGALALIRRNVRVEIALGALVMVAVAVLTTVPTPTL